MNSAHTMWKTGHHVYEGVYGKQVVLRVAPLITLDVIHGMHYYIRHDPIIWMQKHRGALKRQSGQAVRQYR